ncbi:MAG: hypothetical protein K9M81_04375 [Chthoniobacterales bacterium]|nr:hypothetical protein [Chthoniobacterales bacterium]
MDAALSSKSSSGSMYSYSRCQTSSLALPHQPSRRLMTIQYEISGLTRIFHTQSITACGKLIITALVSNYY